MSLCLAYLAETDHGGLLELAALLSPLVDLLLQGGDLLDEVGLEGLEALPVDVGRPEAVLLEPRVLGLLQLLLQRVDVLVVVLGLLEQQFALLFCVSPRPAELVLESEGAGALTLQLGGERGLLFCL